jgi:hypothetical protein
MRMARPSRITTGEKEKDLHSKGIGKKRPKLKKILGDKAMPGRLGIS